jgi:hypothetical protein
MSGINRRTLRQLQVGSTIVMYLTASQREQLLDRA